MTSLYTLVTAPATEPVTLAEAAAHVRQDSSDDDAVLSRLIEAARISIEKQYNIYLVTQTVDVFFPCFPGGDTLRIPRGPLQSVTSVKYTDSSDTQSTFASTSYDADTRLGAVRLKYSGTWPTATLSPTNPVVVRCVMGYGAAADVPAHIQQSILLRIGHLYAHRDEITLGAISIESKAMSVGVDHLMSLDRNWRL